MSPGWKLNVLAFPLEANKVIRPLPSLSTKLVEKKKPTTMEASQEIAPLILSRVPLKIP